MERQYKNTVLIVEQKWMDEPVIRLVEGDASSERFNEEVER